MAAWTHSRTLFAIGLIVSLGWQACGGSSPEAATADHTDGDDKSATREQDDSSSAESGSGDDEGEGTVAAARRPACDDGTCTPCGDAQCPLGWYCDESAKGGPACGWLPECAKKPTCACVKRVFSGSCEERGGGLYVKE
jgi:hypothetical protein